jgi:hypothetical protein
MNTIQCFPRLAIIAAVALTSAPPLHSQNSADCAVYAAALAAVSPDTNRPILVYDSTSMATPSFAFHAWVSVGAGRDSQFTLPQSTWDSLRADLNRRGPLPECIGASRRVIRLRYDSIYTKFADRARGWDIFHESYPDVAGFLLFGKVYWPDPDGDRALLYVGRALHWLSGAGDILFLKKTDGVWRVEGRRPLWRS